MTPSPAQSSLQEGLVQLYAAESITVLHVDDEPDFADLVSAYLDRESDVLEVLTETSGQAALERLASDTIDCIVSDYEMPQIDGLELLDAVRQEHPELPFILFTGKGSEEIASEAISAGVSDYLQKKAGTQQYEVLANRIENAVFQHRATKEVERGFQAIEHAHEGISFLDEDGTFLYLNRAYAETYGYTREELVGKHWETVYPDDQVAEVHEEILPAIPETGKWTGESIHQRKDGTELVVNHALTYCQGGTLICLIEDISEQRETQRILERERERFEEFVDAVEEYAIFALDEEGYITSWNRGAARIKGYDESEIVGEHFSIFYPEAKVEMGLPTELLEEALATGSVEDEGWRVRSDGSQFWAAVVITAVFDADGQHRGFLNVTREMTDGHSEQPTAPSLASLDDRVIEAALNQAPIGVTISGPPAEDVPLQYVNETFTEVTGYSKEEAVGRNCRFLQGEETAEKPVSTLRDAVDGRESASVELRNYRKDGTEFWNEVTIGPIGDGSGSVTNYVGFQQDITERKRTERQLERQLAQFEHFGDVLSHDLRSPLQTARGRVDLALETDEDEHLHQATTALERVDELIEDLADVMRQGDLVDEVEAVELGTIVRTVWDTFPTEEAELTVESDATIEADPEALTRLLENLLRNSLDHGGPTVTIAVGTLTDGFYIEDDGPGVPSADRDRVFQAGYSTKADDHGFGLASVRNLALAHGWDIQVTAGTHGGARFALTDVAIH